MASSRNPDALAAPALTPAPAAVAQAQNPSIAPGDPPSPEMETTAEALTREEVLRRRRRRAARLAGVYRRLYWAMAEEVRARHRQYVWDLARSPLEAEQPPAPPGVPIPAAGEPPRPAPVPRRKKCGFTGCKVRAMATTRFCHSHVLSDPKQLLYKPCAYITKSGLQGGLVTCGRPIIKSAAPSLCNIHLQRCQKSIAQAYRKTRTRGGVRHGGAGRGTSPLAAPALTNRGGTCNHPQSLAITLHRTRDSPFSPIVTQVGSKLAPPAGVHNHIRLHGLHPTASVRLALSRRLQGIGLPQTSPGFNAATVRHPQPAVSPRSPSLVIESEAPRAPSLLWHCLLKTSGRQRQLHGNPSHRRTPVIVMHRPKGSSGKSTFSLQLVRGRPALLPPGAPVAAGPQGASWATKPAPPATKAASHGHCRSSTPLQARPRGGVRPSVTMRRRTGHSRAIPTSPRPSAGGRCICAQMDSDARSPSIWRLCRTADGLLLFVSLRVDCQYVFALTSALPTYKNAQSLLIHINAFLTEVIFLLI